MANPRLATYSASGKTAYGCRHRPRHRRSLRAFRQGLSDAARSDRRRRADEARRGWRQALAGSSRSTPSPGSRRSRRRKRSSASASTIPTATPNTRTARTRRNIRACSCARRAPLSATTRRWCARAPRTQLDYEGEVTLVIGKAGRHIKESDALGHIAALTLCNEGTIRDWVRHAKFNVTQGKNFDSTGSLGPWIVPYTNEAQIADIRLTTRVNGETRQDDRTSRLIFGIPLSPQLHLDLHHDGARRHHRDGHADRRRRAVRSAALSEAGRCRRGRSRRHRRAAQSRRRRNPVRTRP